MTPDRLTLADALRAQYEVERELGRGGMATVYLARDLKHDRRVALKVIRPELAHTVGPERFLREIALAARLQHPHILPVHDSGSADGLLWYTMPYVEGESLGQRLKREPQLPLEDALRIVVEVADALGYAHRHGIVHRDIKPENILLSGYPPQPGAVSAWHCMIADFGIARAIDVAGGEKLTETGLAIGTPEYMSPEQGTGESRLDGRSDLYSLGCVLFEMLGGEPPFTGRTPQAIIVRRLSDPVPHLRVLRDVSEEVERVVTKSLARSPADRFADAAAFAQALEAAVAAPPTPSTPMRRRRGPLRIPLLTAAGFVAVAAGVTLYTRIRPEPPAALDPDLIAVAPFDVLDPTLGLWREGLVDVLARDLDGAGPLRTVSPTLVVRRWRGRADPASAAALGRETGAQLAVFGNVVRLAPDSVRVAATVLDVTQERAVGEVEVRGALADMGRLTDSLAVGLLRQVGRNRPVGAVRHSTLGARSLPALRAFLQAEQYYRRGVWDSAQLHAEQAVALDTTFALAYRRLAQAIGWNPGAGGDSIADMYAVRAASLNHRLAPRDSLLVHAESLFHAASSLGFGGPASQVLGERALATLDQAVRRYPSDPEAWFELGEHRHHLGGWLVPTGGWHASMEAFERAIALDPLFAPAYHHTVEVGLALGDSALARRSIATAVRLNPRGDWGRAFQAVDRLIAQPDTTEQARLLDTLAMDLYWETYESFWHWADSAELAVRVAQHWARRAGPDVLPGVRELLTDILAFRGHLREALALEGSDQSYPFVEAATFLGAIPAERAAAEIRKCIPGRPDSKWVDEPSWRAWGRHWCQMGLPWWSSRGDTTALLRFLRAAESMPWTVRSPQDSTAPNWPVIAARAHIALARRDTSAALEAYRLLSTSTSPWPYQGDRLIAARLLAGRGKVREAAEILNEAPTQEGEISPRLSDVLWYLERGRIAEQLGDTSRAIDAHRYVAAVWRHADAELQPFAAEARAALERLTAEQ